MDPGDGPERLPHWLKLLLGNSAITETNDLKNIKFMFQIS